MRFKMQFWEPSPVLLPRLVLSFLLASAVICPNLYQPALSWLYATLRGSAVYRASTFETFWTVVCYSVVESVYVARFARNPALRLAVQKDGGKKRPKMTRPKHRIKEALTYITPLLLLDLTMIKKFGGVPVRDMALSGNYDPNAISMEGNFLKPTLHRFTTESPMQTARALPYDAPSSRQLVLELVTSILIYDTVFFFFHLALHKLPILSKVHTAHHRHGEIHPQITNQLDVVERLGLVLLANFSLNIIGSHVLTRTIFVPIFVWLLVDIHSGIDQEWGYDKLLPHGLAAGSKRHSQHHQYGIRFYEPFFNWWDDALEWFTSSRPS